VIVHIFKTKALARFAKRERISDASLTVAIENAERGLVDADLGGGVIKQRVARLGQGKSGGYRMLIGFRSKRMAVFLFGFAKRELDNIDDDQLFCRAGCRRRDRRLLHLCGREPAAHGIIS
jgi:hypothetical protein